MKVGVQLYTIRRTMEEDLWGALEKVAKIGYRHVELAGLHDRPAEEWASNLDRLGLTVLGAHISIEQVEDGLDELKENAQTLKFNRVIVPWMPEETTKAGWIELGRRLDAAGAKCAEADLDFYYHNHAHELNDLNGTTGLELIFKNSSAANVQAELDLYWLEKAGHNASEWIQKMAGRTPLTHFKDMQNTAEQSDTEVGDGVMDWDDIIDSCRTCGVEYAVVEHDDPVIDPIESIRRSYSFLREQGLEG